MKKIILHFLILLHLSGCAGLKRFIWPNADKGDFDLSQYNEFQNEDFLLHFEHIAKHYVEINKNNILNVNKTIAGYTDSLLERIFNRNEVLFKNKKNHKIYFIKDKAPFYFSLPPHHIFLSTGLMRKYIEQEELFVVLLLGEMIKLEKNLFPKITMIPIGYWSTERLLPLLSLDFKTKTKMNKWIYYALDRSGYDADQLLSWLQIQNKNILDFGTQSGNSQRIILEESALKSFVVRYLKSERVEENKKMSSKEFYIMKNFIKANSNET